MWETKEEMERIRRANDKALHTVLTPVRWSNNISQGCLTVIAWLILLTIGGCMHMCDKMGCTHFEGKMAKPAAEYFALRISRCGHRQTTSRWESPNHTAR